MTEDNFSWEVIIEKPGRQRVTGDNPSLLEDILDNPQNLIPIFGGFYYAINNHKHTRGYDNFMFVYHPAITAAVLTFTFFTNYQ